MWACMSVEEARGASKKAGSEFISSGLSWGRAITLSLRSCLHVQCSFCVEANRRNMETLSTDTCRRKQCAEAKKKEKTTQNYVERTQRSKGDNRPTEMNRKTYESHKPQFPFPAAVKAQMRKTCIRCESEMAWVNANVASVWVSLSKT